MKRLVYKLLVALLGAAWLAPTAGVALAQERKLSFGSALPARHVVMTAGVVPFIETLHQKTNGRLKWEPLSGGVTGGFKAAVDAVRDGLLDGAVIVPLYTPSEMADTMVMVDLGLLGENSLAAVAAFSQAVFVDDPRFLATYRDLNMLPLVASTTPPYRMMCRSELGGAENLRGKRFWATGSWGVLVRELGGTPVNIGAPEIYEALQRGQLDCVLGPGAWLKSFSLWDVVKSVSTTSMGVGVGNWAFVANLKAWNSLSPADRNAHIEAAPTAVASHMLAYVAEDREVLDEARKKGLALVEVRPDVKAVLAKAREAEKARALETGRRRNVNEPERIVEMFLANLSKWERIVAEAGEDGLKYEAALKSEIYDKWKR
jgi:TRAP-type C4-dicarboxylate transport system substrate-binding protein